MCFLPLNTSPFHQVDQLIADMHAIQNHLNFIPNLSFNMKRQDVTELFLVAILVWLEEQHLEVNMDPTHISR